MHSARAGSLRALHSDQSDLNRSPSVGGNRAFFCMATIWLPRLPEIRNYFGALWCDVRSGIVARQISILIWWWFTNSDLVCGSQLWINGSHRATQNRMPHCHGAERRNLATPDLPPTSPLARCFCCQRCFRHWCPQRENETTQSSKVVCLPPVASSLLGLLRCVRLSYDPTLRSSLHDWAMTVVTGGPCLKNAYLCMADLNATHMCCEHV